MQKLPTPISPKHGQPARDNIFGRLAITPVYFTGTERLQACQRFLRVQATRSLGSLVSVVFFVALVELRL